MSKLLCKFADESEKGPILGGEKELMNKGPRPLSFRTVVPQTQTNMDNEQQAKAIFTSFCIEQYAKAKNLPVEEVVELFERYGLAEHFCEFYDVLHTQGHEWLVEEVDKMIDSRRK